MKKRKIKKMSHSKKMKLINHVFNVMKRKDRGRNKKPAMTNKWGRIIKCQEWIKQQKDGLK